MSEIKAPEQAPATSFAPAIGQLRGAVQMSDTVVTVSPTQVRRPWRSTMRTAFQATVALAVLAPILVQSAGLDTESLPWLAIPLAVAAALTRIMATPQVEEFLRTFVPFLAAAPPAHGAGRRRVTGEAGISDVMAAMLVVCVVVVLLFVVFAVPNLPNGRC